MKAPRLFTVLAALLLTCMAAQAGLMDSGWVPLRAWAKENGFRISVPDVNSIALTRSNATLRFQNGSQLAAINGVNIWLCNSIAAHDGQPYISTLDLRSSVEPILAPRNDEATKSSCAICLDPGHGGKDTGGKVGTYMEKNFTLPLAMELREQLRAAGFTVWLTRTNDYYVELNDRIAMGNRLHAGLFISLHFNMTPGGAAKGVEVYSLTPTDARSTNIQLGEGRDARLPGNRFDPENILLAYHLQKALVETLHAEDRGFRRARFAVLRPAQMPAVLIEGGFLSDPEERRKISNPDYRRRLAQTIVRGVLAYKEAAEPDVAVKEARPPQLQFSRQ